jgi:hypothetical protein
MIVQLKLRHPRFKFSSFSLLLGALTAVLGLTATAHANIVADPGFESAGGGNVYFAGSSIDGGSWNVVTGAVYIDNNDPWVDAGSNSLNLTGANLYATNTVSQTLATVAGQYYLLSFWANADIPNSFSVTENGTTVAGTPTSVVQNGFPGPVTNSSLFVDYTGSFQATSSTTVLDFSSLGDPALNSANFSVMVDNVNVVATPEPSSILLTLTGVAGLGTLLRKRFAAFTK